MKEKFKNDKFKKSRGGYSRLLEISCAECGKILCYYQKDGSGILKRMYLDRIYNSKVYSNLSNKSFKQLPQLICNNCGCHLGIPTVYEKEKRFAFKLFEGSVARKIVKANCI